MDHPLKIFFIISIFVFGLAIYIFLPIRSLANPTVNWGEPQSLYELLRHVLRKQYKPLGGHRTFSLFLLQLHSFIKYASLQMTLPLLIISFLGWIFAWKNIKMNLFLTILFIVIVLGVIGFVNFQPTHHQEELVSVFFLPAVLVISIWLGYAIFKISKLKFYFILPLFPILPFIVNLPENNHARNTVAYRSAYDMLTIFPRRAVLFVAGDFTAFPIAYLQMVEKYRTDVEIFDDYGSLFPNIYGKRFLELPSPLQSEKRKKTQMYFIEKGRTVYCTLGAEMSNWTPILIPEGLNYRTTGGPSLLTFKKFWLLNSFFSFIDNFNLIDTATVNIINQYRFALGEYFFTQGNANKGIKFYKLAADNEKEFEWLLNNMATMITRRGMPKEAKYFYEKIIILNPWYTTAFIGLGNFALAEKNIVAAENYFKRAVEIEPTSAYAHFNLGNIYSEQKRNIEAIEEYKKAIIYDPNYFSAYKNLASVYIEMNMPKAALEVTEKAIQLKPDDYESHYNKGEIEYALHNPEEAFKSWQNAYNIAHQVYEMYKSNPNDIRVLRAKDCMIRSKERMEKLLGARAP
jgi:tetratricopeptide (TPR) repeat protein